MSHAHLQTLTKQNMKNGSGMKKKRGEEEQGRQDNMYYESKRKNSNSNNDENVSMFGMKRKKRKKGKRQLPKLIKQKENGMKAACNVLKTHIEKEGSGVALTGLEKLRPLVLAQLKPEK